MLQLPTIGKAYTYASLMGIATFRVVNVNQDTGTIYLVAEGSQEDAVRTLNYKLENICGDLVETPIAWSTMEKCWMVNVEWEIWKDMKGPLVEDPMTELTRLTEALGGYDAEFGKP